MRPCQRTAPTMTRCSMPRTMPQLHILMVTSIQTASTARKATSEGRTAVGSRCAAAWRCPGKDARARPADSYCAARSWGLALKSACLGHTTCHGSREFTDGSVRSPSMLPPQDVHAGSGKRWCITPEPAPPPSPKAQLIWQGDVPTSVRRATPTSLSVLANTWRLHRLPHEKNAHPE